MICSGCGRLWHPRCKLKKRAWRRRNYPRPAWGVIHICLCVSLTFDSPRRAFRRACVNHNAEYVIFLSRSQGFSTVALIYLLRTLVYKLGGERGF